MSVRREVRKKSNGQQVPFEYSSVEEDFYFTPPVVAPVAANTPVTSPMRPTYLTPVIALPSKVNPASLMALNFKTASIDANGKVTRFDGRPTQQYSEDLGGGVMLEMVPVQGFSGGDYWIGKFEVTQAQWRAVMGNDPSNFKGERLPVENICWGSSDCAKEFSVEEFIKRLNAKLGVSGASVYRLPKEAEWEYAARAGTKTEFAFGDTINAEIVNYNGNYPYGKAPEGIYQKTTVEVGSLGVANAWGLYDMHGNVWEWCEDMSSGGSYRVFRGGSWGNFAVRCRSAFRDRSTPGYRYDNLGFRLVRK
jgi:eukaryotic-like serine/threonine-protein kinase